MLSKFGEELVSSRDIGRQYVACQQPYVIISLTLWFMFWP